MRETQQQKLTSNLSPNTTEGKLPGLLEDQAKEAVAELFRSISFKEEYEYSMSRQQCTPATEIVRILSDCNKNQELATRIIKLVPNILRTTKEVAHARSGTVEALLAFAKLQ